MLHHSDAYLYWFNSDYVQNKSWTDFFNYGSDFILFLNYPFVKIGIPFFVGFLLYGTIGFFGILKFIKCSTLVIGDKLIYKELNFLYLIFLLPNLHFWTASLGKEALIFWGIASVFYAFATKNYKTFSFVVGSLLILLIRPHVALMLLSAITLLVLFDCHYSLKKRIAFFAFVLTFLSMLLYMVFQLSDIRYWNWQRIVYFNNYSILSFKNSGSYVPMLDYNYPYKLFSFLFRPLFYDANSLYLILASIENSIVLFIFIFAVYFVVRYYKKIIFTTWMQAAFLFTLVACLLYVHRYANLGIFMRTKIMFQPFTLIGLLAIITQGISLQKKS